MKKKAPALPFEGQPDPQAVADRARAIAAVQQVQYWLVVTLTDGLELCEGRVPDSVKAQFLKHLHPAVAESRSEYLARLEEVTT